MSVCLLASIGGCNQSQQSSSNELLLFEPTLSDQPDPVARKIVLQESVSSVAKNANWPALFNDTRRSVTDAAINPVWAKQGPPLIWEVAVGTGYGSAVTGDDKVIL